MMFIGTANIEYPRQEHQENIAATEQDVWLRACHSVRHAPNREGTATSDEVAVVGLYAGVEFT
jgi:hypothetical protein